MDEALCIRQWDFSETSQTVSLLCRGLGLVRGLAKGAKRATHPYSGGIELLTRGNVGVIARPSSDLALITEWDLQETFPALRRSLAAHHVGLYLAELIQHAVQDHDPHPRLYGEAVLALQSLDTELDHSPILARFQWALLVETGYKPELERDVVTALPLPESPWYFFDPALGGLVAPAASSSGSGGLEGHSSSHDDDDHSHDARSLWRVRRETIDAILEMNVAVEVSAAARSCPAALRSGVDSRARSSQSLVRAARFLAAYARHVFGREPRTMSLLFGHKLPR